MCKRGRAWRRHIEDKKVIKRLKRLSDKQGWWRFEDANNVLIQSPQWFDFVGTSYAFFYKTGVTRSYDTRLKTKWGKKGRISYDWSSDPMTRPKDKKRFKKELDELGFKHLPARL